MVTLTNPSPSYIYEGIDPLLFEADTGQVLNRVPKQLLQNDLDLQAGINTEINRASIAEASLSNSINTMDLGKQLVTNSATTLIQSQSGSTVLVGGITSYNITLPTNVSFKFKFVGTGNVGRSCYLAFTSTGGLVELDGAIFPSGIYNEFNLSEYGNTLEVISDGLNIYVTSVTGRNTSKPAILQNQSVTLGQTNHPNILPNGSGELGMAGWTKRETVGSSIVQSAIVGNFAEGSYFICTAPPNYNNSANVVYYASNFFSLTGAGSLTLQADIRDASASGSISIYLEQYDTNGVYVFTSPIINSDTPVIADIANPVIFGNLKYVTFAVPYLAYAKGRVVISYNNKIADPNGYIGYIRNIKLSTGLSPNSREANGTKSLGIASNYYDVSPSRVANTNYINTTGKPIFVSIIWALPTGNPSGFLYIDGLLVGASIVAGSATGGSNMTGIVPPGSTYKIVPYLAYYGHYWFELY